MIYVEELEDIVGKDWVITKKEHKEEYFKDETPPPVHPIVNYDSVLVKPENTEQVSQIVKWSNKNDISIFIRGAGTGLVGGCVPSKEGIVISLERFKEIELDQDNLMVTTGAGVTLEELFAELKNEDIFFPPHPGDEGAQIGGLVATNAGGARAVKYGVMRNYVKGMEVVLPTGEVLELGGKLLKNNTGFDFLDLFTGSEGSLGIITRVILRLYPRFRETATILIPYENHHDAIKTVPNIIKQLGDLPLAIEFMGKKEVELSAEHLGKEWPAKEGNAFLMLIITGYGEEELFSKLESIQELAMEYNSLEPLLADTEQEQKDILDIRSNIYTATEDNSVDILDVSVPPAEIANYLEIIDEIEEEYGLEIISYGHAGDGNIHPQILMKDGEVPESYKEIKTLLYKKAIELGGTITAEHGIGETRIDDLSLCLSDTEIDLMKKIKNIFDPNGILNPNKKIG